MIQQMIFMAGVGAAAGLMKAALGFMANATGWKDFESFAFIKTVMLSTIAGAIAGVFSNNIGTAATTGLLTEQTIKSFIKRANNGKEAENGTTPGTGP